MDIKDLLKNASSLSSNEIEKKLRELIRSNYKYKNLSKGNQEVVMDLISKYKEKIRKGVGVSAVAIREDVYKLYRKRSELNLTEEDLKDIKEILNEFKS